MRILLLLFFLIVFYGKTQSQSKGWETVVDSLKKVITTAPEDSSKVKALYNLAREYMFVDPDKGIEYGNQSLFLAQKIKWKKGEAYANYNLGFAFRGKSDFEQTLKFHIRTLEIFEELNDKQGIARVFNELGYLSFLQSDFPSAVKYLNQAAEKEKEIGNLRRYSGTLTNIGSVFMGQSNYPPALEYFEKALQTQEIIKDTVLIGATLVHIGQIYHKQNDLASAKLRFNRVLSLGSIIGRKANAANASVGLGRIAQAEKNWSSALEYYRKALEYFHIENNKLSLASTYGDIGEIYSNKGDLEAANINFNQAMELFKEVKNKAGIAKTYVQLCDVSRFSGNATKALELANKGLKIAKEIGALETQKEAFFSLFKIYKKNGSTAAAFKSFQNHVSVRDSIFNEEKIKELAQTEIKYDFARQQLADSLAFKSEKAVLETKIQSERQVRWFSIGIAVLLGLLAAVWYQNARRRQKTNEVLKSQKAVIETKSKQNELLLKEIHHRVKNNLQTISSLLFLQSAHIKDAEVKEAVAEGQHRVESMALIHQKLYQRDNLAAIEMKDYLTNLGDSLISTFVENPEQINLKVDMPELELDVDTAVPLGLIANELITNSIKYAFPENRAGEITLKMSKNESEGLELLVADNGIGIAAENTESGTAFGSQLIHLLTKQLSGKIEQGTDNGYWTKIVL